jgi:hypothetical protein
MSEPLAPPSLLFEFCIEIRRFESERTAKTERKKKSSAKTLNENSIASSDWQLGDHFLLLDFNALSGKPKLGRVAVAWENTGLFFEAEVQGKKQPIRFIQEKGGVSDGLRVWIDTRNSPNVHRATRFCHCFHFFPGGVTKSGQDLSVQGSLRARSLQTTRDPLAFPGTSLPFGILDEVARAREHPNPINSSELIVRSTFKSDGYRLNAFVPATCLTGYLPSEFDRIRIFYDLVDMELGTQSQSLGPELRYSEDPSLWIEAKLVP